MNCFFCGEPTAYDLSGSCDDCSEGFEDRIALQSEPLDQPEKYSVNPILNSDITLSEMTNQELHMTHHIAYQEEDAKTMNAIEWELSRRDSKPVYDVRYI